MDDPYQRFLTSMSRVTPLDFPGYPKVPPPAFPGVYLPPGGYTAPPGLSPPHTSSSTPDPNDVAGADTAKQKSRKKSVSSTASGEPVKHRRTRSGCFTCRSRRVKCDERRPICDRCQKGGRDCVYPDPPSRKGSGSRGSRSKELSKAEKPLQGAENREGDRGKSSKLDTIIDQGEDEDDEEASSSQPPSRQGTTPSGFSRSSARHGSETPSYDDNRSSPSSSTAASSGFATVPYDLNDFPSPSDEIPDYSHLAPDFQKHLNWFFENMTFYHFGIIHDTDNFFKTILPRAALQNEALLNALVGFSAYQTTIRNPNGRIEDFLGYYNKSVTLLLESLKKKERTDATTLMTILQLAQIEEYLGDWVNILGHQKAALEILTKIFSPENVMETATGRMCLSWFARFDGFVAFMGSFPNGLPKEYFDKMREFFQSQMAKYPGDLNWIIAERNAHIRQISWQQTLCYAKRNRGQLTMEDFLKEHQRLTNALIDYRNSWNPALTDPRYLVTDFGGRQPDEDDIVNPFEPGVLYDFPIFNTTLAMADWHAVMIMHKILRPNDTVEEMLAELQEHAMIIVRIYETLSHWPHTPAGVMTQQQATLRSGAVFVTKNEKTTAWARRKFAYGETMGYIRSITDRERMAALFGDPTMVQWWLPNDEGFTPILQSIRDFAAERNAVARNEQQESVQEVRQLYQKFSGLEIEESPETS